MRPQQDAEILVVLHHGDSPPGAILRFGPLVHSISNRVFTLQLDPSSSLASLQAEPAVRWAGTQPSQKVLDELEPTEQMFIDGWLLRRAGKSDRPGEGLDWDAPGRLPPDPPTPL